VAGRKNSVSLKEHFDALRRADLARAKAERRADRRVRKADQVAIKLDRRWTRERLKTHNNLLTKWQDATATLVGTLARKDALDALHAEFEAYKEITAKALTLAEGNATGKRSGFDAVRTGISFAAGLVVALITAYLFFKSGHSP